MTLFWATLLNCAIVSMVVMIHYEGLFKMSQLIPKLPIKPRHRIVVGVFGALVVHALEVWLFALAYYLLNQSGHWGSLEGQFNGGIMDCVYYSFACFTTLGFGDIVPTGALRFLTGIESLTGLVLITWSASFLYFEMQKYWGQNNK